MASNSNKNRIIDKAWQELFDKYHILDNVEKDGQYIITSKQINEFKEARLMTKFDFSDNLPDLFYDNKLSILPITRGSYAIGQFNAYEKFTKAKNVETVKMEFPSWIETIDYNNLYSEASVINCAFATGIINDVLEDDMVLPTVSGRMSSDKFNFNIHSSYDVNKLHNIQVNNSQCEIDGGYETFDKLMLIEAKNTLSRDFLIRQLYYPYRLWSNKVTKEVVPVFLTYTNDTFSFYIYNFENPNDYNSLHLVKQKNYIIDEANINMAEIKEVLDRAIVEEEPQRPFPQADVFERVIDLLDILMVKDMTMDDITTQYAFNVRQAQYYSRAGMYLGLIEDKDRGTVSLTTLGRSIMSMRSKQKYLAIADRILKHKVFNEVLKKYFNDFAPPTKNETFKIMCKYPLRGLGEGTMGRRAQSVNGWIRWILELVNE